MRSAAQRKTHTARAPRGPAPLDRVLSRPARLPLLVFIVSLLGSAAVSAVAGIPVPSRHDEFSYLLAGETYAGWRPSNPPHPHWEHFESPHILQQPSYASKYQPGQGALLATGFVLGNRPVLGVWLGAALMCAAVTWMLLGLVPVRWALVGGLLTALDLGIVGVWAQSYWGGAVAAAGGALLFGAVARLRRRVAWPPTLALSGAALILLFSRPFEGFIVFLVAALALLRASRGWTGAEAGRVLGALGLTAVLGLAALGAFNRSVTGAATRLPYQLHSSQYDAAPLFLFQPVPQSPEYRSERLARFHAWELDTHMGQRSVAGWAVGLVVRPAVAGMAYLFGPPKRSIRSTAWLPGVLVLPLLLLPALWRLPPGRHAILTVGILLLALSTVSYFVPHYLAVITALWMYLVVQSLRMLRARFRRRPFRAWIVPLALGWSALLVGIAASEQRAFLTDDDRWFRHRERIERDLAALGGRHVVLVGYSPDYDVHDEWVYNSADIDGQEIVWARELGPTPDARLAGYYADRSVWRLRLDPDAVPSPVAIRSGDPTGP